MTNLEERRKKRAVSLESMSSNDAERIGKEVGEKAGLILKDAEEKLNEIFKVYGLEVRTAVQLINKSTGETTDALTF